MVFRGSNVWETSLTCECPPVGNWRNLDMSSHCSKILKDVVAMNTNNQECDVMVSFLSFFFLNNFSDNSLEMASQSGVYFLLNISSYKSGEHHCL